MTKKERAEQGGISTDVTDSQPNTAPSVLSDEERYGRDKLRDGLASVIERGRISACMPLLGDEEAEAMVDAWYAAVLNEIPCKYWKEVGLWTSRYVSPADKFTVRQFFEAWQKFCEQGRARGYEPWR